MSTAGLDVFDKTLQSTHIWLDEMMSGLGPDRQRAWRALGASLRAIRDQLPVDLSAHLGAQLPLLIRGAYYDQWQPSRVPSRERSADGFIERIAVELSDLRPMNPEDGLRAAVGSLSRHADRGQLEKVRAALPEDIRRLWPEEFLDEAPSRGSNAGADAA